MNSLTSGDAGEQTSGAVSQPAVESSWLLEFAGLNPGILFIQSNGWLPSKQHLSFA